MSSSSFEPARLPSERRPRRSRESRWSDDELSWHRLEKQYQSGEIIRVRITGTVRHNYPNTSLDAGGGGILVTACGLSGLIPNSHKLPNKTYEIGEETAVKILEASRERRRLILSEREARLEELLNTLEPGNKLWGTVSNLTEFGAFVDLAGATGLVHISELAHKFVKHPREVVSIGERVEVKVLSVDKAKRRINLSLKQTVTPAASEVLRTPDLFEVIDTETGERNRLILSERQARFINPPAKVLLGADAETGEEISLGDVERCGGLYVLGQPRTGKSHFIISCALQDMEHGHGLLFIDPHGDAKTELMKRLPEKRIKDVILLDPTDPKYSFGLNVLYHTGITDVIKLEDVRAQAMNIFMKVWENAWGVWLEKILSNSLYLLLENPGYTLVEIPLLLTKNSFREALISKVKLNPYVVDFWHDEFDQLSERDKREQIGPTQTRLNLFRTNPYVRQIVGYASNPLDFTSLMNTNKIVLLKLSMNLSPEIRTLIGTMMISQLLNAAYARDKIPEERRNFFALYCDEFQNFMTPDFARLLTQTGKYKLMPTVAHQERVGQFKPDDPNRGATLAAANRAYFRLSVADAEELAPEFAKKPPPAAYTIRRDVVDCLLDRDHPDERVTDFVTDCF